MTIDFSATVSIMLTIIGVGVALGGLIWKLHHDTQRQVKDIDDRIRSLETGLSELRGFLQGLMETRMRAS